VRVHSVCTKIVWNQECMRQKQSEMNKSGRNQKWKKEEDEERIKEEGMLNNNKAEMRFDNHQSKFKIFCFFQRGR
jgi:hypothetical protein